jgi:hypothetical protein
MQTVLDYPDKITIGSGGLVLRVDGEDGWTDTVHVKDVKVKTETEEKESLNARGGQKKVAKTFVTKQTAAGSFVCNYPNKENLAMFFMAETPTAVTQVAGTIAPGGEPALKARLDKWVEIGKRIVSTVVVKDTEATPNSLVLGTDYLLDAERGLIMILSANTITPPVAEGDDIKVTCAFADAAGHEVKAGTASQIKRHVWFIGDPVGGARQEVKGFANLKPSGELSLIGEEEQEFTFEFKFEDHIDYRPALLKYTDWGVAS